MTFNIYSFHYIAVFSIFTSPKDQGRSSARSKKYHCYLFRAYVDSIFFIFFFLPRKVENNLNTREEGIRKDGRKIVEKLLRLFRFI